MADEKKPIKGKELFLGMMFLLGGFVSILLPVSTLKDLSLKSYALMGISFVMLGTSYVWTATEGYREWRQEKRKIKEKKE